MEHNQVLRLIGVDFGTSTSLIRVKRYRGDQPVGDSYHAASVTYGNGAGDSKAVTLVRVNEDNTTTCGRYGEEEAPGSTIYREFKMDLESEDPQKRQRARELTGEFFKYLYDRYKHQTTDLGGLEDRERTLISYPAKWKKETVAFMEQTAREAGFPDVSSMDEPTAALYAVLCRRMGELSRRKLLRSGQTGYVLLIDMGAGTTDLAVCGYRVSEQGDGMAADQIKTILVSTWPGDNSDLTFGGREVDRILETYVVDYLKECGFEANMAANLVKGKPNVKLWKEDTVSNLLGRNKMVNTCSFTAPYTAIFGKSKPFPAFGRREFQQMLAQKLDEFQHLVTDCLDDAVSIAPDIWEKGIDLVVLTGGHSSWYFTGELLDGTMPGLMHPTLEAVHRQKERILRLSNPQETVALGLVYSQLPFHVEKADEDDDIDEDYDDWDRDPQEASVNGGEGQPQPGPEGYHTGFVGARDLQGNPPEPALDVVRDDFMEKMQGFISAFDPKMLPGCRIPINPKQYGYLSIPSDAAPFISFDSSWFGMGKSGTVFSKKGIYYRHGSERPEFCSWRRFVDGTLDLYTAAEGPLLLEPGRTILLGSFSGYNAQLRVFMIELQKLVRTLLPEPVRNPLMPANEVISTEGQILQEYFSSQDPLMLEALARNVNREKLAARLRVPARDRIHFAHNSTTIGNSKYGTILTDRGIYYGAWLASPVFTSWEEFRNGSPYLVGNCLWINGPGGNKQVGEISVSDVQLQMYRQQWFEGLCVAICGQKRG